MAEKYLSGVKSRLALKGQPYTVEEIDQHENASRIWATIAQCYREAQEEGRKLWGDGYWAGISDRNHK